MERIHKLSAAFVFAFLCLHFANHFAGLLGVEFHIQFMQTLRALYYVPVVEYAVLAAFAIQILTGLPLIWEIWTEKKDIIHQFQAASGAVMTLFILTHIGAVLVGRHVLHLDTNFHFAAAGLMSPQWKPVFLGYYGAGVFSLFLHFGCIAYDIFKKANKPVAWLMLLAVSGAGAYVIWLLLQIYSGALYPVEIPADYARLFGKA
ncbi:putative membrane protein [Asticcacaulis biprosthecium C19]|uniref:Putative membrane protein n=1 Tax=Asticcacaulis biprosthecium C19 TaxID=715226 RepID=F4QJN7_9CAUL|nr:hypothetical protein [Asticcacaulis biprosthecium]EGF91988.1 putative membrane protein [Asticcacaulis biprosthecium C19]